MMEPQMMQTRVLKQSQSGASYFFQGFDLIRVRGVRRYVLIPLAVNMTLFSAAFIYLFGKIGEWIAWLKQEYIPDWLGFIDYLLWPLLVIFVLIIFSYLFSTVANWIAAPFNGLLSEKIERHLSGQQINGGGMMDVVKDIPRTLAREWSKLVYYLPKAIACLILFLIPALGQTVAPVIWFLFTAWMMAIQYVDYPFDNRKIGFARMKQVLGQHRGASLSFGTMVTLFTMIPLVNLVVMPVAVCGATAMWVDQLRQDAL